MKLEIEIYPQEQKYPDQICMGKYLLHVEAGVNILKLRCVWRRHSHKKGATTSLTGYEMRNITLQSTDKRNLIHRKMEKMCPRNAYKLLVY
jgi:hypothetical protein